MPVSTSTLLDRYVARGLALVRVANSLGREAEAHLRLLRRRIRELLAGASIAGLGRRGIAALLRDIETAAVEAYGRIAEQQGIALGELVAIEAEFAARAVDMDRQASDARIERAAAQLLVLGHQQQDNWRREASNLAVRIRGIVQNAAITSDSDANVLVRVLGTIGESQPLPVSVPSPAPSTAPPSPAPAPSPSGEIGRSAKQARALIDAEVHAAAHAGRMAEFAAAGVQAVRWHAILDPRVCPACGVRAGKRWDLSGVAIGHALPLGTPPPAHYWCRCILLPLKYPDGIVVDDEGSVDSFQDFLKRQSPETAAAILGKGRAELWRRGVITLPDLINQAGQVLTLAELKSLR